MLSGLIDPTSGTARVAGCDPTKRENAYRRLFALVLGQKNQLWWDLPAIESFTLLRAIYGIPADQYKETLNELVQLLDVEKKLNVMVRELSLGERMKMELIAALLHRPRVLFLDEPTIGLDVISQKAVRSFLREYNRKYRVTILLTSHYMADIKELCERVIVIHKGKRSTDGALDRLEAGSGSRKKILTFLPGDTSFPESWTSMHGDTNVMPKPASSPCAHPVKPLSRSRRKSSAPDRWRTSRLKTSRLRTSSPNYLPPSERPQPAVKNSRTATATCALGTSLSVRSLKSRTLTTPLASSSAP